MRTVNTNLKLQLIQSRAVVAVSMPPLNLTEAPVAAATSRPGAKVIKDGAVWSSGVPFYPPSEKYWRIGGKWYDLTPFLDKHPGGRDILLMARDRFEDSTFVFEAHHHDYKKARAIIRKYEVSEAEAEKALIQWREQQKQKPSKKAGADSSGSSSSSSSSSSSISSSSAATKDEAADLAGERARAMARPPQLLGDDSFYSEIRRDVTAHLKSVGCPAGGPTAQCVALFWMSFVAWVATWAATYWTGSFALAVALGFTASWLGAFGHNWVHQPKYKWWAYLSLDTVGFSSDGWYREHVLQHHMYTNTPWDNHFRGTDPFLVTDPTVPRAWIQRVVLPVINPVLLTFGLWANYWAHFVALLQGQERASPWKLLLPLQVALMVQRWGFWHGFGLLYVANGVLGIYYFTMALMNHNAAHCHDVKKPLLKPTQQGIGYAWVQRKLENSFQSSDDAQDELKDSVVPVVVGPGAANLYILDHHHTLMALELADSDIQDDVHVYISVVCDYRSLSTSVFWQKLVSDKFAYLLSRPAGSPKQLPSRIQPSDLPNAITTAASGGFVDDPWRSWASFVRKIKAPCTGCSDCPSGNKYCNRGYSRDCASSAAGGGSVPFFEFRWAYFMNDAFNDSQLWPSSDTYAAFKAVVDKLPAVSTPGKADADAWAAGASALLPLLRGASASTYVVPSTSPSIAGKLPGFHAGASPIPKEDPDCNPPTCPAVDQPALDAQTADERPWVIHG
eukprot:g3976.t1